MKNVLLLFKPLLVFSTSLIRRDGFMLYLFSFLYYFYIKSCNEKWISLSLSLTFTPPIYLSCVFLPQPSQIARTKIAVTNPPNSSSSKNEFVHSPFLRTQDKGKANAIHISYDSDSKATMNLTPLMISA